MNGPEHYREAEAHIKYAAAAETNERNERYHLAMAQAHATLALTAATVATRAFGPREPWGGHTIDVAPEWQEVTA